MTDPYRHLYGEQQPADPYAHLYGAGMSPAARDSLAAEQKRMDEPPAPGLNAKAPPGFKPDATRQGEAPNPNAKKMTGVSGFVLRNVVDPMLEHPLATALTANPVGGAIAAAGMAKDVAGYAGQKAAEMTLPADVRKMAEQDPERISGEQAAVEAFMLALPGVLKGVKVGAKALGSLKGAEIPADAYVPIRNALKNLTPKEIQIALADPHLGPMTKAALESAPKKAPKVEAPKVADVDLATAGDTERHAGLPIMSKTRDAIRTAYRSALVTPNAGIEGQAPDLAESLNLLGASSKRAQHMSERRLAQVFDGLTDEQKQHFGAVLTRDNLDAAAQVRAAQGDAQAAQNLTQHAADIGQRIPAGVEAEPWFQKALGLYKANIEAPLTSEAVGAGVDPANLRQPKSAYVRLASEQRLDDAEIRRALDIAGVTDPADLQRRPALLRKLVGENPALARYFAQNAQGPRQGPIAKDVGPSGLGPPGPSHSTTGSAKSAQGTAQSYSTDLSRITSFDASDKITRAARNRVLDAVAGVGRKLAPGEAPKPGMKVFAMDRKNLVIIPEGETPITSTTAQRYEVTPEVHKRVTQAMAPAESHSAGGKALQGVSGVLTRAQIAGMPVEATSHANTLSSIVGSVPGEKDWLGHVIAAIPGPGGKAAAIREMIGVDFKKPEIRALENRLADIGALRIETKRGGLLNSAHHWLFGEEGVDVRGRLALARKYLKANPKATDAALREFINGKLGNYIAENSGALPNFMAKGSVFSPFARFQSARIPTAIKTTLGESGLPSKGALSKTADVAKTLYRGPVGHVTGVAVLTKLLTGQWENDEPGHALDVGTGLYAVPGGIKRLTKAEAEAMGDKASPIYIPAATLNPVAYAGLRATGARSLIPKLSPDAPASSRVANAVRDQANVALGTAGPLMRFLQGAVTGTQPYLQADNTFLRTAPKRYGAGSELRDQIKGALENANPAVHAFAESGGDAGRTLTSAMEQDGKRFGGPASIAARVAAFTLPRIASPGIGGRTNEQSTDVQLDRRYREATADYIKRIRRAPGPDAVRRIIVEAARDAERNGYDPDAVIVALEKAAANDNEAVAEKQNDQRRKRLSKIRP